MQDGTVNDVLLYLPDWTTEPLVRNPHRKYARAFVDEEEEEEDFNSRRHVTEEEVIGTYNRTRRMVAQYLNRDTVPDLPVVYDYVCMWTAGVLAEKYRFKEDGEKRLIEDSKEALEPYKRYNMTSLNTRRVGRATNCTPYHDYTICEPCYKHRRPKPKLVISTTRQGKTLVVHTHRRGNSLHVDTTTTHNTLKVQTRKVIQKTG